MRYPTKYSNNSYRTRRLKNSMMPHTTYPFKVTQHEALEYGDSNNALSPSSARSNEIELEVRSA
jgi:hypothetical protein